MTVPPILAFGFASPWLLGGLALAAIPIVIHLLYKRKFRETPWAAMRFLVEAARKQSRRIRLEQLLLLSVRVLLLALIALGLARPYMESIGAALPADAPAHKIVVIDASFSMGSLAAERTGFDDARDVARRIVDDSRQGDAFNLMRISDLPPRTVIRQPAYQSGQVAGEIDRLVLGEGPGDVRSALTDVEALLEHAPAIERKELFLISDFQRSAWAPSGGAAAAIAQQLERLSEKAKTSLIDVGPPRASNSAVTAFRADQPFVTIGQPVPLTASISNFGGETLNGRRLDLNIDGKLVESTHIDLPPRGEARAEFIQTFTEAGEHRLEVRLEDDGLPVDNHRWLALPVKEKLNVLLVNGRPAGRPADDATHYLETVLSPSTSRTPWKGPVQPTVVNDGELSSIDLSNYDGVCLCDVALLTEREADLLVRYVEDGGGLVVFLGPQVRPDNYNLTLYRDGSGVLPARLGNRVGNAANPQTAFEFDAADLQHPIVNPFVGNPGTGLESSLTFEYFQVQPTPESARVVLRYSSGDPAIVESALGRGRVVLVTTSADTRWGTWPIHRSFPPLVHEIVRYVVEGRWSNRQQLVGEPLHISVPSNAADASTSVIRPDGRSQPIAAVDARAETGLTYEPTDRSGIYEVSATPPSRPAQLFAVNVDTSESDPAKLSENEIAALMSNAQVAHHSNWKTSSPRALALPADRGGLTPWLLTAALGLLLVELLMAWNFRYGFFLLAGLLAAAFVSQGFVWHPAAGIGLALLSAAALAGLLFFERRGRFPRRPGV